MDMVHVMMIITSKFIINNPIRTLTSYSMRLAMTVVIQSEQAHSPSTMLLSTQMLDKCSEICSYHHRPEQKQFLNLKCLRMKLSCAWCKASAPINQEQLHYLMSRGLSKQEATSMIVEGFLIDSFTGLDSDFVRDAIQTRLTVHLECQLLG